MNQEVIYSILLSPAKTQAEKEKKKKKTKEGGRCCTYILTSGSLFEDESKVGFFKQALVENEPLYPGVSRIILMESLIHTQSHKVSSPRIHQHKNIPPFSLWSIFSTFPPFVSPSIHPALHPSPSKASSQQSAIEFHYSLVMQHFKGWRAACMCVFVCVRETACAVHCEWAIFFFPLPVQGISSSGTQRWCPQPIFILQCVQTVVFWRCCNQLGLLPQTVMPCVCLLAGNSSSSSRRSSSSGYIPAPKSQVPKCKRLSVKSHTSCPHLNVHPFVFFFFLSIMKVKSCLWAHWCYITSCET